MEGRYAEGNRWRSPPPVCGRWFPMGRKGNRVARRVVTVVAFVVALAGLASCAQYKTTCRPEPIIKG